MVEKEGVQPGGSLFLYTHLPVQLLSPGKAELPTAEVKATSRLLPDGYWMQGDGTTAGGAPPCGLGLSSTWNVTSTLAFLRCYILPRYMYSCRYAWFVRAARYAPIVVRTVLDLAC